MIHLRVVAGPHSGLEVSTRDNPILLGRSTKCQVVLKRDEFVSRFHGEIYRSGGELTYRDLQSKSGSMIESGGTKTELSILLPKWPLKNRDKIRIGESVIAVQWSGLPREPKEDHSSSISVDDFTMFQDRIERSPESGLDTNAIEQFLRLPESDLTDIRGVKLALCRAFLDAFQKMNNIAIVGLKVSLQEQTLEQDNVNYENSIFLSRDTEQGNSGISFSILEQTARTRTPVLIKRPVDLPDTESVMQLGMESCICMPMFDGQAIIGFIQMSGAKMNAEDFRKNETDLLRLLVSVSSLILRQANSAQIVAKSQRMASVGQAVAALSHDARSIMESLGNFAESLEKDIPELTDNLKWSYIRQDLDLMRFLIRHTNTQMKAARKPKYSSFELSPWVRRILEACDRYFINEVDRSRIQLSSLCEPGAEVYSDPDALSIAFLNCVKNAVDAYLSIDRNVLPKSSRVIVSSFDARDSPEDYYLLSIADTAGGISEHVLRRMGRELITTKGEKGTGLGFQIVVDTVRRLRGVVHIASSTVGAPDLPAGTIISLRLPKHASAPSLSSPDTAGILIEDYELHFKYIYM